MNPKIAEHWERALKAYNDAKTAFQNRKSESDIKKELWNAILYGQCITRELESDGEESLIAAETAIESFEQLQQLSTCKAFDLTLQALREYRNLAPDEYNLPIPSGLKE